MTVEVRENHPGGSLKDFLKVVERIYGHDPVYIRALDFEMRRRLNPGNPYFQHSSARIFTAYVAGQCVGRAVAHVNREHLARHQDEVGFFGFFDTINDKEVSSALLDRIVAWHRSAGTKILRGPISLNMAEEVGCLIEGFDTPPMLLMGHHHPYQSELFEAYSLRKAKDAFAWRYHVHQMPERVRNAHAAISAMPEVRSRTVDMKRLDRDIPEMLRIYNDAWQDSWGYVALTQAEADQIASDFKLVAIPELTRIVEIEGEPAAMCYALPNLNELIRDFNGRLFPTNALKLVWRLKARGPKTARLVALGIRKKYRNLKKYAGLGAYLFAEMNESGKSLGILSGELSFTLEDNAKVNTAIKLLGGKIYKKYRIYELPI